ncbi:hypothetical protein BJY52DRAFT_1303151 [Lactarius psammicola]|nr:hypothetical protein BJY52DRAFT_1303151 [Lactarius psammicola]
MTSRIGEKYLPRVDLAVCERLGSYRIYMTRISLQTPSTPLGSFCCGTLHPSLHCTEALYLPFVQPLSPNSHFALRSSSFFARFLTPMTRISVLSLVAALITSIGLSRAESHTIRFDNQCGTGTPQLVIGGKILSNGEDWTSNGPEAGIAYLQTGQCSLNGEHCTLLEFNLNNPACAGCGSSVDISLVDPHALNVPITFSYFNGCDGQGATCTTPDCRTAFHRSSDNQVQVACQDDNVDLLITFCSDGNSDQTPPASAPQNPASSEPMLPASTTTTLASISYTSSLISYVPVRSSDVPSPPKPSVASVLSSPVPLLGSPGGTGLILEPKLAAGEGGAPGKTCKRRHERRAVARAAAALSMHHRTSSKRSRAHA